MRPHSPPPTVTQNRPDRLPVPTVSMVLSVHNGEQYIRAAVDSVLDQTFEDFELLVVNDGSTDGTADVLLGFDDPRLCVFDQRNLGLTKSLNNAIRASRGKYIARLDADETADPTRLARQVSYLDGHLDVGIVGSYCRNFRTDDGSTVVWTYPTDDADIRALLPHRNPFVHGAVMLRREAVAAAGMYDESFHYVQDYELWGRIAERYALHNLPEILVTRRITPQSLSERPDLLTPRIWATVRAQLSVMRRLDHTPLAYLSLLRQVAAYVYHTSRAMFRRRPRGAPPGR